jgi:hypothetical protein
MYAVPVLENTHQSLSACPVSSGPVVTADVLRHPTLGNQTLEHAHRAIGVDAALDQHRQRLARELINHVQQPDHATVRGLIMLVIQCPYLVRALRPQPLRGNGPVAQTTPLTPALRYPQPLLAPQPLNPLAVYLPALRPQLVMRAAVSPPRTVLRELSQLRTQRRVIPGAHGLVTLSEAMLPHHPASPALADAKAIAKHRDRLAPTGWAYQFPRDISFNA